VRSLLLDVGGRDNFGGEMEPLAEVVETLRCQGVIVVLPRELRLDIAPGVERLARLDDKKVLRIDVRVLRKVEVLLGHENALSEEVLQAEQLSEIGPASHWKCCLPESIIPRGSSCGRPWE